MLSGLPVGVAQGQIKHLIEITVIDRAFPTDTQEIAAHHLVQVRGIEVAFQKFHVVVIFAAQLEVRFVARDRHVAKAIEMIELNAEFIL